MKPADYGIFIDQSIFVDCLVGTTTPKRPLFTCLFSSVAKDIHGKLYTLHNNMTNKTTDTEYGR